MLRVTLIIATLCAFDAALIALVVWLDRRTQQMDEREEERQAAIKRLSEPLPRYDHTPLPFPRGLDAVTVEDGRTVRERRSA